MGDLLGKAWIIYMNKCYSYSQAWLFVDVLLFMIGILIVYDSNIVLIVGLLVGLIMLFIYNYK